MVSGVSSHILSGLGAQAAISAGKTAIAVLPAQALYAHFKHVSGVPAPDGISGVPVNKLKILDSLIEQMRQLREGASTEMRFNANMLPDKGSREERLNNLVEFMKSHIDAMSAAHETLPYARNVSFDGGAFFNLNV